MLLNNYFFLRQVSSALKNALVGAQFVQCKKADHEYLFSFSNGMTFNLYESEQGFIYYWGLEEHDRSSPAPHPILPQFNELKNKTLESIEVVALDRIWIWKFTEFSLVFKLFGKRANVLLYPIGSDLPKSLLVTKFKKDLTLSFSQLIRSRQSELDFPLDLSQANWMPSDLLAQSDYLVCNNPEQWEHCFSEMLDYSAVYDNNVWQWVPTLSLEPKPDLRSMLEAYYRATVTKEQFEQYKFLAEANLLNTRRELSRNIEQSMDQIERLTKQRSKKEIADIIMAHLHLFKEGVKALDLEDFYQGGQYRVELPEGKSAVAYATQLYKKAPGDRIAIAFHRSRIAPLRERMEEVDKQLQELGALSRIRDIKKFIKKRGRATTNELSTLPYKKYTLEGYAVLIGRNAKSNDLLLRDYTSKNDLWFHARDVSGSHAIIKTGGKAGTVPNFVKEEVASWAAWFSKSRNQSTVAVMYTERKYVRKGKDLPAGMVLVDKSATLLVRPKNPDV